MNGYSREKSADNTGFPSPFRIILILSLCFGLSFCLGAWLFFRAAPPLREQFSLLTLQKFDLSLTDIAKVSSLCLRAFRISLCDFAFMLLLEFFSVSYIPYLGCGVLLCIRGFFLGISAEVMACDLLQSARPPLTTLCLVCGTAALIFLISLLYCLKAADAVCHAHTLATPYLFHRFKVFKWRFYMLGTALGAILLLNVLLSFLLNGKE